MPKILEINLKTKNHGGIYTSAIANPCLWNNEQGRSSPNLKYSCFDFNPFICIF